MKFIVLFILSIFVIGCGNENELSLALDWYPNSNHAGIYSAIDEGFFDEEGIKLSVYTPSDPTAIISSVASGRDDFGLSYHPDILQAQSAGLEIVSVLSISQHPLNSIMTLKKSSIKNPSDLKGKVVGYPGIPSNKAMLETVLSSQNININDVETVDVGFELVKALVSGSVDAIIGAYWTHESIVMELQGYEIEIMRLEEWGVPDYYELILITNKSFLEENKSDVEKVVNSFKKGYEFSIKNPQESITSLISIAGEEIVEEDVERAGVELLIPMWQSNNLPFGHQDISKWEETYEWMYQNNFLEKELIIENLFIDEFSN
ncbi:MAG: ABC transporter substrate-binding protein [Chloroflexota bacterium]|nr:pyrimidine biosynthesis enzyme [Chloroflexota bacterium]MED5254590.1 ABC transporter substrate-binding protein [Chloroflexota bacterium]|tara:strand:+ start:22503 stop:23459 length:957 start_codon:yes stop_codon:yes gene_type:complete